jgi:peptide/nickel transport system permease protein
MCFRLRRFRSVLAAAAGALLLTLFAAAAPLIASAYGAGPQDTFPDDLDGYGMPYGVAGGVSTVHWLGLEPGLGRDLFIQIVYGLRTSLAVAGPAVLVATVFGTLIGALAGFAGGWIDALLTWCTDVAIALPLLLCAIAVIRPLELAFYGPRDAVPGWFRMVVLIGLFAALGWTGVARLVRGQVRALRERDFVTAAIALGARPGRILTREVLPHLGPPITAGAALLLPMFTSAGAALSFLGLGVLEPTPDLGRTVERSLGYLQTDPAYVLFPGLALVLLVFVFTVLGESVRRAFDPGPGR